MIKVAAIGLLTLISAYDRKSPPPPRQAEKPSCLRVINTPRCIPVDPLILRRHGLTSGTEVQPRLMIQIDDENRALRGSKLR